MTLRTAWAFPESARVGFYTKGMGGEGSNPREQIGTLQVKRLLDHFGYHCNITTPRMGDLADRRIREFQKAEGLVVDGIVGINTMRELLTPVYRTVCVVYHIVDADDWGGCQMGWESVLDPGATYINSDDSLDRGLYQYNNTRTALTGEQAYDPLFVVDYRMNQARAFHDKIEADCKKNGLDAWKVAISANRSPVGAMYWSRHSDVQPVDHRGDTNMTERDWAEFCAFYMTRVDTGGRATWTGKAA